MRAAFYTLIVTIAVLLIAPQAAPAAEPEPFFPILAWDMCRSDPGVLKKMKECGITIAGFANPSQMPAVREAGLKAIVADARVSGYDWNNVDEAAARKNVESLVKEVGRDNAAVFGYYLRDEPPASMFAGLGKVAGLVKEFHPGAWPYINLFPNYATAGQLAAPTYDAYLEKFVEVCHPPIVSYDHYALLDNGALRDEYWANLESMSALSRKHHVPFWNIVLSCAHFTYREPTQADMLFQAYTTLAYGGRGLAYFTYFCPQVGNYRASPIDQFGHETATWRYMQFTNLQVLKLAPTLLHLNHQRTYHFTPAVGTQAPPADSWVTNAGSPNYLVAEFLHDDGSKYVLIVNKDLTHSGGVHSLAFRTAPAAPVQMVSPYTGQLIPFEGEQRWLAPGAGVLLKL